MLTDSALYTILAAALNLSPSAATAQKMIRAAYQPADPSPEPSRADDLLYYHLAPDPAARPLPEESVQSGNTRTAIRYLPYRLTLTFYGPDAERNALLVRTRLYQDGKGNPLSLLRAQNAYPVPCPPAPAVLFEPAAARWRKRADLTVSLRIAEEASLPSGPSVAVAPRVTVWRNGS